MNINDQVVVVLTEHGERAWAQYWYLTSPDGVPDVIRKENKCGKGYMFSLWQLMHIFGQNCYNGSSRLPFVNNEVKVVL